MVSFECTYARRGWMLAAALLLTAAILAMHSAAQDAPSGSGWTPAYAERMKLWYRQPAKEWVEALPVGNGRLGAMVFGRPDSERIQINEESVWGGRPVNDNNPEALARLPEIRRLLFEGRNAEATELATRALVATPPSIRSYQTLMDLHLIRPAGGAGVHGYVRALSLGEGIQQTRYTTGGVEYVREVFASAVDDVLVLRWTASVPGQIQAALSLSRPRDATVHASSDDELVLSGQIIDETTEA